MHQFTEHTSEMAGFSSHFAREIAPQLAGRDSEREEAVRKGHIYGASASVVIAIAGLIWTILARNGEGLFYGLFAAGGAYPAIYAYQVKQITQDTKDTLVGSVFRYVGWTFSGNEIEDFDRTPWDDSLLLPKRADRETYSDRIHGPAHGALFQSVECHLEVKVKNGYSTKFLGQLMWMTFDKPLGMGRTLVLRDKGLFNTKRKKDMKRVGLADPVFEKLFEAYSDDQVGARVVLDPAFMQRIVDLEQSLDGKNIRLAFYDKTMLIAVETKDLFEAGSMTMSLADPSRAQRILDEVAAIFNVVDTLLAKRTAQFGTPGRN